MTVKDSFTNAVMEQFGYSRQEAERIYRVFLDVKALVFGHGGNGYSLAHGAFWDKDVMDRALAKEK